MLTAGYAVLLLFGKRTRVLAGVAFVVMFGTVLEGYMAAGLDSFSPELQNIGIIRSWVGGILLVTLIGYEIWRQDATPGGRIARLIKSDCSSPGRLVLPGFLFAGCRGQVGDDLMQPVTLGRTCGCVPGSWALLWYVWFDLRTFGERGGPRAFASTPSAARIGPPDQFVRCADRSELLRRTQNAATRASSC